MIQIFFDFKPMSINSYYENGLGSRRYVSDQGKVYQEAIREQLRKCQSEIDTLLKSFNPKNRLFKIEVYLYQKNFYTKKGLKHMRAGDVDGPQKMIIDTIFKYMKIDDAYLNFQSSMTIPSHRDCFSVVLSTCVHPKVFESPSVLNSHILSHEQVSIDRLDEIEPLPFEF